MIHLELFWSFFQIGLFSIGGGYAAMPLIQHQVVELHPWLTLEQFSDIITISQMTPGPIAINSATFVGLQLGGLPGALVATAGCVLPSCIIVLTLAYVYYRYRGLSMVQGVLAGLRPAVVAMIASAGVTLVNLSFFGADALPVNGSLGTDGIKPLLGVCEAEDKGIFVLVKTSNPSSGELQDQKMESGKTVYETMGEFCEHWGESVMGKYG